MPVILYTFNPGRRTPSRTSQFSAGKWQWLLLLLISVTSLQGWGQRTIFSENMGTPSGTTTIASNTFQNPTLTFSGTGDVRNTTTSSGYTGASAGGNVFLTNNGTANFQIAGISTVNYSSISLSFGIFKSSTTGNGSDLIVEVSTDGSTFSPLSFTALTTGTGTAIWFLRTASGTIPSTANLRIRFRQNGTATQYRIDDVILTGTPANPTTTSITPTSATAGGIAFSVTVDGTNFISGVSTVTWNGSNRTTTFVSSTQVTAAITAVDIATAGSATVGVTTTGAATANSNTQSFTINASVAPVLTSTTLSGALSTTYGTASSPASFTAAGTNLTGSGNNITATPQANFEIATSSGGTYSTTGIAVASGTQLFVRLAATAPASAYNGIAAVVLSGGGASPASVSTTASLNAVSAKGLTITGLFGVNKNYDGLNTASFTGIPAYSGGFANGESYSTVSGTGVATFATALVGTAKVVNITGFTPPNANYSVTQPILSADVTPIPLTIIADNVSKSFNTTLTTPVSGVTAFSSSGLVNSETIGTVTITYTAGTSASAAVGLYAGAVVPSAATGGTFSTGNYSPITYTSGDLTIIPASVVLAGWDFSAATNYGTSPQTAGTTASNVTVTGLVRSSTIDISNAAAARGYGGAGFNYSTAALAIAATRFFTVTIKPATGYLLSLSSINPFYYRRSSAGAQNVQIQYSLDGSSFTDVGTVSLASSSNSGALALATLLNSISNLQNLSSSITVTLRFIPYGATGATGTFYFYDAVNSTANDFVVNGSVVLAPVVTGAATAAAFTTTYGAASAVQTFSVSGANLTANLVATAPTGFEVSSDGTTYGGTATFTQTSGTASGTLSVRLAATAGVGMYNSQNIVLSSTNANSVNIATASTGNVVNKATPTLVAPSAGSISFGQTLAQSTLTGGSATNPDGGASVPGSFAFTTLSTAPNAGTANQSVTFTPTDAANFNTATVNVSVTVSKATPTLVAPSASNISFGQTLASSTLTGGSATNPNGGASVPGNFAFTTLSTAPNAGTSSQAVTFTPTDAANFNTATVNVSVTVGKATPTLVAPSAGNISFGQTLASSALTGGSATNPNGGASVSGSFAFTTLSTAPNAGTANQPVTFTPTDAANFNTATVNVSVTVTKATPTITTLPMATAITFGQTLASSLLSGGVASVAGIFTFSNLTFAPDAGIANLDVIFTPADGDNYNTVTTSVSVTVVPLTTNSGPACVGTSVTLNTEFVSGATYSWTGPNGFTSTEQNPVISSVTAADAGVYTAMVTTGGSTSSAGSTTLVVKVAGTLIATPTDVTCEGAKNGLIGAGIMGGTATGTYTFTILGDVFAKSVSNTTGNFIQVNGDTYTVTARSADGCEATPVTGLLVKTSAIIRTVVSNVVNATCLSNSGSFVVSKGAASSAATGNFTYNYSSFGIPAPATFVNTTGIFTNVPVGTYTIYAKDDVSGCVQLYANNKVTIKAPATIISLTPTITPIVCNGGTATVKLSVKGGKAPYMFSFNGSAYTSSNTFKAVAAGNYTSYSVTDANSCIFTGEDAITITEPALLVVTPTLTHPTTKTSADGAITVAATGGAGQKLYKLNFPSTNPYGVYSFNNSFSGLKPGSYTVYVRDAGGCTKTVAVKLIGGGGAAPLIVGTPELGTMETAFTASVAPNPTTSAIVLRVSGKSSETVTVRVVDLYGRVVYRTTGSGAQTYSFGQQFASGLYLVEVWQAGKPATTIKVVKAR